MDNKINTICVRIRIQPCHRCSATEYIWSKQHRLTDKFCMCSLIQIYKCSIKIFIIQPEPIQSCCVVVKPRTMDAISSSPIVVIPRVVSAAPQFAVAFARHIPDVRDVWMHEFHNKLSHLWLLIRWRRTARIYVYIAVTWIAPAANNCIWLLCAHILHLCLASHFSLGLYIYSL